MERLTMVGGDGRAYCDCVLDCYSGCQRILKSLAAYEDSGLTPEEAAELARAKAENRLIILPVPIGEPIYVIADYSETDGAPVLEVEEMHLSGYIKEGKREFYATYDNGLTCDIDIAETFATYDDAEAALNNRDN